MRVLFMIPSPRHIPEVIQPIKDILYPEHDVIWFKYYPELEAYNTARKFFLDKNYDYMCIIPDDLIINKEGIDILLEELKTEKYKVLAGVCNLSYLSDLQFSKIAASHEKQGFITKTELEKMDDITKVYWIGFSCYFIHRSVLEIMEFESRNYNGLDDNMALNLKVAGIDQYICKRAMFTHLKGLSSRYIKSVTVNPDIIYTGKREKFIIFHTPPKKVVADPSMVG